MSTKQAKSAHRMTFRETAGSQAWQKQLRDQYANESAPPVALNLKTAIVRKVSRRLAEQIILKYEWLGTMASTGYHYGIFFGPYCAGVVCFAVGGGTASVNAYKEFHIERVEFATLARGACVHWAPPGTNSKLVNHACKLLAKDSGAKLVLAYSDTDAGEIGTIYQACNWVYAGKGSSTMQFISPQGRIMDQKLVHNLRAREGKLKSVGWSAQRDHLLKLGWTIQLSNPKHRYVKVLDTKDKPLVQRIERMRKPYPKREQRPESIDGDALAFQAGASGFDSQLRAPNYSSIKTTA